MKILFIGLTVAMAIFIIGCGDSSSSTSYEENGRCAESSTSNNLTTSYEINTSGAISMNCESNQFSIGGSNTLNITNRSFEITHKRTFMDGSSWHGTEILSEAEGSYSMSGSHTMLGDYTCKLPYTSKLPSTISNDDPDGIQSLIYDVNYSASSSTLIGQLCPEWVDDGTLENNVKSSETFAHYALTDSGGKSHTISQHTSMTQNIMYQAVVEHELASDITMRIKPENIVVLNLERADDVVDANDTDTAGTDCYTYLHDQNVSVALHVGTNSSIKAMRITNKTSGLHVEASAGENNSTYMFTADEEHEVCVTHDGLSEGRTLFVRIESLEQHAPALRFNPFSAARLVAFRSCNNCNLSKANLKYTRLKGASIKGADLSKANLYGADLEEANLGCLETSEYFPDAQKTYHYDICTILSGANLKGTNFKKANLKRASLNDASLQQANLSNANCYRADFYGANMENIIYKGADFSEARWWNDAVCEENSIGTCKGL